MGGMGGFQSTNPMDLFESFFGGGFGGFGGMGGMGGMSQRERPGETKREEGRVARAGPGAAAVAAIPVHNDQAR